MPDYFVHESSYVDENCTIGTGTNIWNFSHVMPGAHIGENCNIGQNVFIDRNVHIGNRCKIQNNVSIYDGVYLEDDVFAVRVAFSQMFTIRVPLLNEKRISENVCKTRCNHRRKRHDYLWYHAWRILLYRCRHRRNKRYSALCLCCRQSRTPSRLALRVWRKTAHSLAMYSLRVMLSVEW